MAISIEIDSFGLMDGPAVPVYQLHRGNFKEHTWVKLKLKIYVTNVAHVQN